MATMYKMRSEDLKGWSVIQGKKAQKRWLGQLVWSTIGEIQLVHDQMLTAFEQAGLSPALIPAIHPKHAFQRATAQLARDRIPLDDGLRLNLLVRPIKEADGTVLRAVVEEVVDTSDRRLSYYTVAHLLWNSAQPDVAEILNAPERVSPRPETQDVLLGLPSIFETAQITYNGRALRELVDRLLVQAQPISVRRAGGVIFVPHAHQHAVTQFTQLVTAFRELSGHEETEAYAVPVVNHAEHRVMIKRAATVDLTLQLQRLGEQCQEWIQNTDRPVRKRTVTQALANLQHLRSMITDYAALTEDQLTSVQVKADQVTMMITQVMNRVDID